MKRFLCAIAMLVAFIPFVGVKAINETTNYYSYKKGQIVNFYPNKAKEDAKDSEALEVIIVEDKDTSGRFIKVWSMAGVGEEVGSAWEPADNIMPGEPLGDTLASFRQKATTYLTNSNNGPRIAAGDENALENNYFIDFGDANKGFNFVTFDDLQTMFGNALVITETTKNDGSVENHVQAGGTTSAYVPTSNEHVSAATLKDVEIINRSEEKTSLYKEFEKISAVGGTVGAAATQNGFYVLGKKYIPALGSNTIEEVYQLYLAKFTWNTDGTLKTINIVPATQADQNDGYMVLPTLYANKTADCHEAPVETHCYKCVNENGKFVFKWTTPDDKEVEKCELQNDITSKKDCSELVKTGVESHILEFAIVAALCVIALIVVKRKDLFKTI